METEMNCYYQIYFGTDNDVTSRAIEEEVDRVLLKSAILKLNSRYIERINEIETKVTELKEKLTKI